METISKATTVKTHVFPVPDFACTTISAKKYSQVKTDLVSSSGGASSEKEVGGS